MSPSGSCLRCQEVLAVESANGLCVTCSKALETSCDISSRTPSPDDRTASRPELVGVTLTHQVANGAARTAWVDENGFTLKWDGEVRLPNSPAGYDLYRYLGGGGMGDVYLAREHVAERTVAMKFLRGAPQSTAADRFLTEVRSLARLNHPNIIRVISVDLDRSDPHFTMEFAPGGTLSDRVKAEGPMPPLHAARIVAQVARAIEVAHGANILHRDLKPSNIVLGIDDIPKVTDFGLAKLTDRDEGLSMSTGPLGTPSFMPPEQISSKFGKVGPASDVYGLGATLYHLLTGRPPFQGDTQHDIITQVQNSLPERISSVRPEVPGDLEGIVVKCLEKNPLHRYPTALALAEDLERFLAGQVPLAPRQTRLRRVRRWVGRNRILLAGISSVCAVAAVLAVLLQPQDPHDEMIKGLKAGRSVELVGKTGNPRWYEWKLTPSTLAKSAAGDDTASFQTEGSTLLELVRDPGIDRYRITADLRHMLAPPPAPNCSVTMGFIGLYCGYDLQHGSDGNKANSLVTVKFADIAPLPVENAPKEIGVRFGYNLFVQKPEGLDVVSNWSGADTLHFKPRIEGQWPGLWRRVRIDVTPEGVTANWWDDAARRFVPIHRANLDSINARFAELTSVAAPLITVLPSQWKPRGPLGILAYRSTVSFKNVSIEPLP